MELEFRYPHRFENVAGAFAGIFGPLLLVCSAINNYAATRKFIFINSGRPESISEKIGLVFGSMFFFTLAIVLLCRALIFRVILTDECLLYRSSYGRRISMSYKDITHASEEYDYGIISFFIISDGCNRIKIHNGLNGYRYFIAEVTARLENVAPSHFPLEG